MAENMFEEWQSYDRKIVPVEAGAVQREECRRAFYAGAWAMYWLVMSHMEKASDDEDGSRRLLDLERETHAIVRDLRL